MQCNDNVSIAGDTCSVGEVISVVGIVAVNIWCASSDAVGRDTVRFRSSEGLPAIEDDVLGLAGVSGLVQMSTLFLMSEPSDSNSAGL